MNRIVAVMSAALIVLVTGFVHGTWTQRWQQSAELDAAVARLDNVPMHISGWLAGNALTIEPEELKAAGAEGCWVRDFTSTDTGHKVHVIILCGPAGRMCVHRPENCYPGQGFDLVAAPVQHTVHFVDGSPEAEFWTARFAKPDVTTGGAQLRIFWAWDAADWWQAPEYPRWTFAAKPYLYKLYVIRPMPLGYERPGEEPAMDFLRHFLPELTRALAPASNSH